MTKKRRREGHTVEASPTATPPSPEVAPIAHTTPEHTTPEHTSPEAAAPPAAKQETTLMDEVQSFLAQRAELAKKLADEIEATEKKLAELKKTAALLFPENSTAAPKEKKPKKVAKVKATNRDEQATSEASTVQEAA